MKLLMKLLVKVVILLVVASMLVAGSGSWGKFQIKQTYTADGELYYVLCAPTNASCKIVSDAVLIYGSGSQNPPIGAYCYPVNGNIYELDCGDCYRHLMPILEGG